MSSNIQLLRNARLWVSSALTEGSITKQNTREILIQDDFTFTQGTSSSDVSLEEAGPTPARGSARFNDSLDPVEWSFSTYMRSFQVPDLNGDGTLTDPAVITADAILWHCLASAQPFDLSDPASGVFANEKNLVVTFEKNQSHSLTLSTLYILVGTVWYKISSSQVGQAEVSFDIGAIAQTSWSGTGAELSTLDVAPFDPESVDYKFSDTLFREATYIKNKLTVIKCKDNSDSQEYIIPITGGSLTISNNITHLTPSTLSRLDQSIGSFAGSFEVTGSLTAYLRTATAGVEKYTAELLKKMQIDRKVTNSFEFALCMGGISTKADGSVNNTNAGGAAKNPISIFLLPSCHLSTPSVESSDVIGTSIEFKAIPSNFSVSDSIYIGHTNDANNTYVDNFIRNHDMADNTI
jgi:hypothetical protein